jgi:hypothetical protein
VLDYGDYKVFGRIDKSIPEEELSVGMEMKSVVQQLPNEHISYVFQKV